MKNADLLQPAKPWDKEESWAERIDACASMLYVHGYIPQSTRAKINEKLARQLVEADTARMKAQGYT